MAKIGIGNWAGKINVRLARGEVKFTIGKQSAPWSAGFMRK